MEKTYAVSLLIETKKQRNPLDRTNGKIIKKEKEKEKQEKEEEEKEMTVKVGGKNARKKGFLGKRKLIKYFKIKPIYFQKDTKYFLIAYLGPQTQEQRVYRS